MTKRPWLALILAVLAFLCVAGWTSRANTSSKESWEYKIVSAYGPSSTNPPPNIQHLNDAGADGWELIEIRAGDFPQKGSNQVRTDYYFKRLK